MGATPTTNYGLAKPTIDGDNDTWGQELNDGMDTADAALFAAISANTAAATAAAPPGLVGAFASSSAPAGWLACNGAAVSRTAYANLFAAAGTTFGAGNGTTTFNVPDLRGYFARGLDTSGTVDPGRTLGSVQADAMQGHDHSLGQTAYTTAQTNTGGMAAGYSSGGDNAVFNNPSNGPTTSTGAPSSDGTNGTPRTAAETRPKNVALLYCVKT